MFGFGWVRIHFGDVFLKSIQVFLWFLVGFMVKWPISSNLDIFGGSTPQRREPHAVA